MFKKIHWVVLFLLLFLALPVQAYADRHLTLMLDWFPNVDHLPIYLARDQAMFRDAGLEVEILSPSETTDGLKLVAAGKVDLAVSYQPQTIMAAARGLKVRAVGRLVGHPLTTVLFLKDKGITKPSDLDGKRIGYTVAGLMDVLLDAFARLNGINRYRPVNVGFAIAQSLAAGKVAAVMGGFKTYETVTLAAKGIQTSYFELEKYGIPDYDELVFVSSDKVLAAKGGAVADFVKVVEDAIAKTRAASDQALAAYFRQLPAADRQIEKAAFGLTLPYYAENQVLEKDRWQRFADFARANGLIDVSLPASRVIWQKP